MELIEHPAIVFLVRFAALVGSCVWFGGFMFYGGVVIPILDEAIGQLETGLSVTRHVTNNLNFIGLFTLCIWWLLIFFERSLRPPRMKWGRCGFLFVSSLSLLFLMVMHVAMDEHLDRQGVKDFKPSHRLYLMISTIQWVANLSILGLTIRLWTGWNWVDRPSTTAEGSTSRLR